MSETTTTHTAGEDTAGRHRGPASAEEPEKNQAPHGKHRRPEEN